MDNPSHGFSKDQRKNCHYCTMNVESRDDNGQHKRSLMCFTYLNREVQVAGWAIYRAYFQDGGV